jgi:A/G-specific adenine glycosylase
MLQQTQVERVIPKYRAFIRRFPTCRSLSEAPLSDVLILWQGLGYNRRAKMLHEAAKDIRMMHKNKVPRDFTTLCALAGIGPYTASAVRVFAYNEPDKMIETNIRSAYLHHFFSGKSNVPDSLVLKKITVPVGVLPRVWYAALMDYGSYLKKMHPNPSRQSAHHVKQKPFKGSSREVRGAIVRSLTTKQSTRNELYDLPFQKESIDRELSSLTREGLISSRGDSFFLAD